MNSFAPKMQPGSYEAHMKRKLGASVDVCEKRGTDACTGGCDAKREIYAKMAAKAAKAQPVLV